MQLAEARALNQAYIQSTSWRLTAPLRTVKSIAQHLANATRTISTAIRVGGGLLRAVKRFPPVYRKEGIRGLRSRYHLALGLASASPSVGQNKRWDGIKEAIDATNLFNATWYLEQYPDVSAAQVDPLEHYLSDGEREGRSPGPAFSATAYYLVNPDIRSAGVGALWHYALHGKKEGRQIGPIGQAAPSKSDLPDTFALHGRRPSSSCRLAVIVHVYYSELWPEISAALTNISEEFDLYVTLVRGHTAHMAETIRTDFPRAETLVFPNHGRDIFPFIYLNNTGLLTKYDIICKLHTKKSLHRVDGDVWRRAMIKSLLGSKANVQRIIAAFDSDPDIGIVAATKNVFTSEYWGANVDHVGRLAEKGRLKYSEEDIKFAAGSMFWIHPLILRLVKLLELTAADFEIEAGQLDGTMAHAIERFFGIIAQHAGMNVIASDEIVSPLTTRNPVCLPEPTKLVAFYLPQFHPIPDNDRWWGKGFTEWTNVSKAKAQFLGHRQPRLPSELGFYDLRLREVREAQAELANEHGISAFCYYYYWFDGRRLLERPLDEMLVSGRPDFPFCLCWANENWARNWDGLNKDVLMPQEYSAGWATRFARDVIPYLKDPRYLRHKGKPVLTIYRLTDIPQYRMATSEWRRIWNEAGIGAVHLCAVLFHSHSLPTQPRAAGVDAYVEFPPHGISVRRIESEVKGLSGGFDGLIYDYSHVASENLKKHAAAPTPDLHRGVMLGWDNTARRTDLAHIAHGATPGNFRCWLRNVIRQEENKLPGEERLVFINAWNEWAEGTYLEPDAEFGRGFLEAVKSCNPRRRAAPSECK